MGDDGLWITTITLRLAAAELRRDGEPDHFAGDQIEFWIDTHPDATAENDHTEAASRWVQTETGGPDA